MTIDNGGNASPVWFPSLASDFHLTDEGMTLRDYFAAKAMQGFIANGEYRHDQDQDADEASETIALLSYLVADAMLKARNVQQ